MKNSKGFTLAEGATHVNMLPTKAKGFTLAEVLITLGIIGVVAALTIPTLMTNYKKKQYYTQFMKARSALENAIKLYEDEHGILFDINWNTGEGEELTGEKVKNLAAYFHGSQLVTDDNYEDMLSGYNKIEVTRNYDGSGEKYDAGGMYDEMFVGPERGFITNDGMLYIMNFDDGFGNGGYVDINGPNSGPNIYGRDIFVFYLNKSYQKDSFCNSMWGQNSPCVPLDGSSNLGVCYGDNKWGFNCAARLIERGKMDY